MLEYKTKFIPFSKSGGAAFAKTLEKALNTFSKNNWNVQRSEMLSDGYLIVVARENAAMNMASALKELQRRVDSGEVKIMTINADAAAAMPRSPRSELDDLTPASRDFLDTFFNINNLEGETLIKQMPVLLPKMCQKYAVSDLAGIFSDLEKWNAEHAKTHSTPCQLSRIVTAIIAEGSKHVRMSTS